MILGILTVIICGFAFVLLMKFFWAQTQPKISTKVITLAVSVLITGLTIMVVTGRMHILAAFGTVALPFLRRALGLLRFLPVLSNLSVLKGFSSMRFAGSQNSIHNAKNTSESSDTSTSELSMSLNHQTGEMDGRVLFGKYDKRSLRKLSDEEIIDLYDMLQEEDSRRLMKVYLEKYRPEIHSANSESADNSHYDSSNQEESGEMSIERARAILNLEPNADRNAVIDAHRRLIQKLHPDRGGSSYLASQLNKAKQILINALN